MIVNIYHLGLMWSISRHLEAQNLATVPRGYMVEQGVGKPELGPKLFGGAELFLWKYHVMAIHGNLGLFVNNP